MFSEKVPHEIGSSLATWQTLRPIGKKSPAVPATDSYGSPCGRGKPAGLHEPQAQRKRFRQKQKKHCMRKRFLDTFARTHYTLLMKTHLRNLVLSALLPASLLPALPADPNIASNASTLEAHYTASWNSPSALNDGVTGYEEPENTPSAKADYPIQPVDFTRVHFSDAFWLPRLEQNQTTTIPIALEQCYSTGRVDNFKKAAGLMPGYFDTEYTFDDTDIYKILEGMSYSIQVTPSPELEAQMDTLIRYIALAQEPDGYLYTARTAGNPAGMHPWVGAQRWEKDPDQSHELYCSGHLFEAAVAHYNATGKRTLLEVAIRNADLLVREFLVGGLTYEPGHQIVEMGLVKMYRATGNEDYLRLAQYFLDLRGQKGVARLEYNQTHKPVVEQDEAVGHAVRAVYMYSGMADVAALTGNKAYLNAIDALWENVVGKKYYLTGGIGAQSSGEAFGQNYELPNESAYCETCAAIGNVYWNHRMFLLHGEAKYYDVIERTLYNGLISGISLSGDRFFYPNPLQSSGNYSRSEWFGCACCPSNLCRFTASIPGYTYAQKGDSLYVNLFVQSSATLQLPGTSVQLQQESGYPWEGNVTLTITPEQAKRFSLLIRIPGWAQNRPVPGSLYTYLNPQESPVVIKINGSETDYTIGTDGYVALDRTWNPGDRIELLLPMNVKRAVADPQVGADRNRVALERGPLVYCLEWPDNGGKVLNATIEDDAPIEAAYDEALLNGVVSLRIKGKATIGNGEDAETVMEKTLTAIPYYAWANRGEGEMAVWINRYARVAKPISRCDTLAYQVVLTPSATDYTSVPVTIDAQTIARTWGIAPEELAGAFGSDITFAALNPDGSLESRSTAYDPGHWFDRTGTVTNWDNGSYVFSEYNYQTQTFTIGQYPNMCPDGSHYRIRQALTYTAPEGERSRFVIIFDVYVTTDGSFLGLDAATLPQLTFHSTAGCLHVQGLRSGTTLTVYRIDGRKVAEETAQDPALSLNLPAGIYIACTSDGQRQKVVVR
jgi:DUF1680 family protein